MCLIIDANVVSRVFKGEGDPDFANLHGYLFGTGGIRVAIRYGGKLRREYERVTWIRSVLRILDQAGRAIIEPDEGVDAETKKVKASGLCSSDDEHVIALARVSGVRALCSHDKALHTDFTTKELIDVPRGRVYQNGKHDHILRECCSE